MAQFISKRDGYTADPEDIYLTRGGANGIKVRGSARLFMQLWKVYFSFSIRPAIIHVSFSV